jgi:hypothetical protein
MVAKRRGTAKAGYHCADAFVNPNTDYDCSSITYRRRPCTLSKAVEEYFTRKRDVPQPTIEAGR